MIGKDQFDCDISVAKEAYLNEIKLHSLTILEKSYSKGSFA